METTNLIKKIGFTALLIFSMLATTACPSKKADQATVSQRYSRNPYFTSPNGNSAAYNQMWGAIYTNSQYFGQVLAEFMVGASDLGNVSGNPNDSTGIRVRGQVVPSSNSGHVDIMVWDDIANTSYPYYWSPQVVNVSMNQNGVGSVTVEDNAGRITFNGAVQNGRFTGQVSFDNSKVGGQTGMTTLGQFSVDECAFFVCP